MKSMRHESGICGVTLQVGALMFLCSCLAASVDRPIAGADSPEPQTRSTAPRKVSTSATAKPAPSPSRTTSQQPGCALAASIPYWDHANAVRSLRANADLIEHVSMFWYHLTPRGKIEEYKRARPSRELISFAHEHGIKVFALIANLPDDEREGPGLTWDAKRVRRVLRSPKKRQRHVRDVLALVEWMDFDGIHIDYEALPTRYQDDFTSLIAELGEALHSRGKLLAVALHSKSSERNPREDNGSWAQDWSALAPHVDQLHLMTYSQHTAKSAPGPVASIAWLEPILRYAAEDLRLSADKVFVGMPLYGEEWRRNSDGATFGIDEDLTFRDVQRRIREHDGREFWSSDDASPYGVYEAESGSESIVWFENARSSKRKLQLAKELGLCSTVIWRLGGEDPDVWPLLRESLGNRKRRGQQLPNTCGEEPQGR